MAGEREIIAALVARLGGFTCLTERELDAAKGMRLRTQLNDTTREVTLILSE